MCENCKNREKRLRDMETYKKTSEMLKDLANIWSPYDEAEQIRKTLGSTDVAVIVKDGKYFVIEPKSDRTFEGTRVNEEHVGNILKCVNLFDRQTTIKNMMAIQTFNDMLRTTNLGIDYDGEIKATPNLKRQEMKSNYLSQLQPNLKEEKEEINFGEFIIKKVEHGYFSIFLDDQQVLEPCLCDNVTKSYFHKLSKTTSGIRFIDDGIVCNMYFNTIVDCKLFINNLLKDLGMRESTLIPSFRDGVFVLKDKKSGRILSVKKEFATLRECIEHINKVDNSLGKYNK